MVRLPDCRARSLADVLVANQHGLCETVDHAMSDTRAYCGKSMVDLYSMRSVSASNLKRANCSSQPLRSTLFGACSGGREQADRGVFCYDQRRYI